MEDTEAKIRDTGDRDSEDDELGVQDDDSEYNADLETAQQFSRNPIIQWWNTNYAQKSLGL